MIRVVLKRSLLQFKDRQDDAWLFIGSSEGFASTAACLPDHKRILIGRMIQEVVDEVRARFIDYVGMMASLQDDKILWYSSRVASKATGQTWIFHHYVYFKLLERLASQENDNILVVTDDEDFFAFVKSVGHQKIKVVGSIFPFYSVLIEHIQGWRRCVRFVYYWLLGRSCPAGSIKNCDVLLHSWIDQRVFESPTGIVDPYLGDLEQWLKQEGLSVGRIVPLIIPRHFQNMLKTRFKNIYYPLRMVSFLELLKVLFSRFDAELPDYKGEDARILRVLFLKEIVKERRSKEYCFNLLLFYGYRRLFRDLPATASVIYPFENTPWEKAMILALPKGVKKIAYSHSVLQLNWLSTQTSEFEISAPTPDVILTMGSWWADFLRPFYPDISVEVAGALRYAHLTAGKQRKKLLKSRNIVVALPIDPLVARSLQEQLFLIGSAGVLDGFSVKIKPHPYLPDNVVLRSKFLSCPACSFVENKIVDLLEDCGLLITASSTVAYESLAFGVKTFVYVPEMISWGIEYFIKDHVFLAYEDNFQEKFLEAVRSENVLNWDPAPYFRSPDCSVFLKYTGEKK